MALSNEFKINVNKLNANEALLILLEITHPFLSNPIRLVNDNAPFIFNGENFIPTSFRIERQSDVQSELPQITLSIPNVGRSLVRWIDSSGGGANARIDVILARRSAPTVTEERLSLFVESISITTDLVVFSLVIQNNFTKRAMRYRYDTKRAEGLF